MKAFALLWILFLPTVSPVRAQSPPEPEPDIFYDIYVEDSCLTVWVDLAPLLTARTWERLNDGVDVALDCRLELNSPRWLWSDRLEAVETRTVRLSFIKVTGSFLLTTSDSSLTRSFPSARLVGEYLSDSIEVCLRPYGRLDPERTFRVTLRLTSIFLTDLNLANEGSGVDRTESPVKFLFRQFLELTDYGRRQYSTRSRPFTLAELVRTP